MVATEDLSIRAWYVDDQARRRRPTPLDVAQVAECAAPSGLLPEGVSGRGCLLQKGVGLMALVGLLRTLKPGRCCWGSHAG